MKYLNQLEYRHIPYRTKVKMPNMTEEKIRVNIASAGCGLCCACMMVEKLTDTTLDIEDCVKIAEECLSNYGVGTDMAILGPVLANKFGLHYEPSLDPADAVAHLQRGGFVIAHVVVPEGEPIGLFTKGGHYISLISTDGENFCILDPSYTPEKFEIPERVGKVNTSHAPYLYCPIDVVHAETKTKGIKYHLFSRKCD